MPKTYNTAAKLAREMASSRREQMLTVGLVDIGLVIVFSILLSNNASFQIGGVGLLVLLIALRVIPDFFDGYLRREVKTNPRAERLFQCLLAAGISWKVTVTDFQFLSNENDLSVARMH